MSVPTNVIDRLALISAVQDRLSDIPACTGHLSKPVDVPLLDEEGHVERYWTLHPWGGVPTTDQDLGETAVNLDWGFQLTVVGPTALDCYSLAVEADSRLYRWAPQIDDLECGGLLPPEGYSPGSARVDEDVKPVRFWLPLQYRTTVTR